MATVRNENLDIIRGIAAFLVIAGHTLQVNSGYSYSPLFNFINIIQMPLFMLVSGYAIGYSKQIQTFGDLIIFIKKRSISLLIPWLTWSMLSYFILSSRSIGNHIQYCMYHMEAAYWFLFSLWCIDMIFAISSFLSRKAKGRGNMLLTTVFCCIFTGILLYAGTKTGMSFLGIKYTTYYIVFFIIGWFLQRLKTTKSVFFKLDMVGWVFVLLSVFFLINTFKLNIVDLPDIPLWIAYRFTVSLSGCFIIFYIVENISSIDHNSVLYKIINKFNIYSLELYVVQGILINGVVKSDGVDVSTITGLISWSFYLIIMSLLSFSVIRWMSASRVARFVLFGKNK